MLLDVLILVFFAFFIFGIVGLQLFMSKTSQRCAILAASECIMRLTGHRPVPRMRRQLCATRGTRVGVSGGEGGDELCSGPSLGSYPNRGDGGEELVSGRPVLRHPAKAGSAKFGYSNLTTSRGRG